MRVSNFGARGALESVIGQKANLLINESREINYSINYLNCMFSFDFRKTFELKSVRIKFYSRISNL